MVFDREDNLYVVDHFNSRVQKFTKDGKFLLQWGSKGDDPGQFDLPWGRGADVSGMTASPVPIAMAGEVRPKGYLCSPA